MFDKGTVEEECDLDTYIVEIAEAVDVVHLVVLIDASAKDDVEAEIIASYSGAGASNDSLVGALQWAPPLFVHPQQAHFWVV